MDEQKIIFSNRFEKEKFEDYKTDLGTGNTITPDFTEADDFLKFIQKNRRSVPSKERIADKDKFVTVALFHRDKVKNSDLISFFLKKFSRIPQDFAFLSSGFEIFFEKSPKRIAVRKVNQATSASCKAIASFAIRAFTSSSCVCFAFSAGIALTTKIVPPILSTKPVFIFSTVITSLRKNRGVRFRTPCYLPKKGLFLFIDCLECGVKVSALILRERDALAATLVVRMPLSDVQLGIIAVPRNKVGFAAKVSWARAFLP